MHTDCATIISGTNNGGEQVTREEEAIRHIESIKSYVGRNIKDALDMATKALEQEPCDDAISRKSLKQKLQEHHDFFVNAYGGFSNLPRNDKSRVDEISNCIAMVVNEPPITSQTKKGKWVKYGIPRCGEQHYKCTLCGYYINFGQWGEVYTKEFKYCPNCGAKMEIEE